jgi:hypothetical protein
MKHLVVAILLLPATAIGKDQPDALILHGGARLQGTLAGCDAKGCTIDGKTYARAAIEWIGLGSGPAAPPNVAHPEIDEEHLRDGSIRAGRLLSIDVNSVVVAAATLPRGQVAFVHLAGPRAPSASPGQADQPNLASRVVHYSVRVEALATRHFEIHVASPHHVLTDTKIDWTGVWQDVALEVNEGSGRIDPFHAKGTPYAPDWAEVSGKITASLAYHEVFWTPHPPNAADVHECTGDLPDKEYPARLTMGGGTKPGGSWLSVSTRALYPAGGSDPELLAGKQAQGRECAVLRPGWPGKPPVHISPELVFAVVPPNLELTIRSDKSQATFYPLEAILAHQSFTLDTGRQHWQMPSPNPREEGYEDWQAKIEFIALGTEGSQAADDCVSALASLASIRDQACNTLSAATTQCQRDAAACDAAHAQSGRDVHDILTGKACSVDCGAQLEGLQRACSNATRDYEEKKAACTSRR